MRTAEEFSVAKEEREEAIKKRLFKLAELLVEEMYNAHRNSIFFTNCKLARKAELYGVVWNEVVMSKLKALLVENGYQFEPHYKTTITRKFVFLKEEHTCIDGYILSINNSTTVK